MHWEDKLTCKLQQIHLHHTQHSRIGANVYSEGAKAYLNNQSMESSGVKAAATTIVSTAMERIINKKFPTSTPIVKEVLASTFSSSAVWIVSDKLDEKMKEKN